jgi:hypothetical protein
MKKKNLSELGSKMGLKDDGLKKFIREKQSRMRDEREKERRERQAQQERKKVKDQHS